MKRIYLGLVVLVMVALASCTGNIGETEADVQNGDWSYEDYFQIANQHIKEGNLVDAVIALTSAIGIDESQQDAYRLRGNLYQEEESFDLAAEDYQRYLELNPTDADIHLELCTLWEQLEEYGKAEAGLRYAYSVTGDVQFMDILDHLLTQNRTQGNSAANISNRGHICEYGDWIFFTARAESNGIYRMRKDGSNPQRISDATGRYLNVYQGKVYYSDVDASAVCRMNLDGSSVETIIQRFGAGLFIEGETIYYCSFDSVDSKLYAASLDGSNQRALLEDSIWECSYHDGWMYYSEYLSGAKKVNVETGEVQSAIDQGNNLVGLLVGGDWLYFAEFAGDISTTVIQRLSLETGSKEPVTPESATIIYADDQWVCYQYLKSASYDGGVIQADYGTKILSLSTNMELDAPAGDGLGVIDGNLYYYNADFSNILERISLDGGTPDVVFDRSAID